MDLENEAYDDLHVAVQAFAGRLCGWVTEFFQGKGYLTEVSIQRFDVGNVWGFMVKWKIRNEPFLSYHVGSSGTVGCGQYLDGSNICNVLHSKWLFPGYKDWDTLHRDFQSNAERLWKAKLRSKHWKKILRDYPVYIETS